MGKIGIHCENVNVLRERCRVSNGLRLVGPEEAAAEGYYPSPEPEIIVPSTYPREATDRELSNIVADAETTHLIQMCRLPKYLGEQAMRSKTPRKDAPYEEIISGIRGRYAAARLSRPDQLSLTTDPRKHNPTTLDLYKVGMHIDTVEDPNMSILVGNMGPGGRWHCLTPEFNREAAGGPTRAERLAYLKSHPDPDSILTYWLKLEPPTDEHFEAILNSPVASVLHDGSTLGIPEFSTTVFYAIDPVEPDTFPSILAGEVQF